MRHAAIAHVSDVEETVDPSEVDEGAEVGNVLHNSGSDLIDLQFLHQLIAFCGSLRL